MFVILVLLQLLASLAYCNNFVSQLGLACPKYFLETEEPKKTKAWRKCDESSVLLLDCLSKGHKVKETADFVDRTNVLCEYLISRDHVIHYSGLIDKKSEEILSKYHKSKDHKKYVTTLKDAFVKLSASDIVLEQLLKLNENYNNTVAEAQTTERDRIISMLKKNEKLTEKYREMMSKKKANFMFKLEEMDLHEKKPHLHKENRHIPEKKLFKFMTTSFYMLGVFGHHTTDTHRLRDNVLNYAHGEYLQDNKAHNEYLQAAPNTVSESYFKADKLIASTLSSNKYGRDEFFLDEGDW